MAAIKEANPGSPIQFTEVLRTEVPKAEQNSFVLFIDQNKDLFDRHSSLTYELRDEVEGWRDSPTVDQIVNDYIDLIISIVPKTPSDKQLRKVSRNIRKYLLIMLFSSPDEKDNITKREFRNKLFLAHKINSQQVPAAIALYDRMMEFNKDFNEGKAPVAAEVQGSKVELSSKFKNYLLSDPNSIFAFRDFLLDKKYASTRAVIRPFLASFAQSEDRLAKDDKGEILGETVKKWVGEISEKGSPDLLDEFVASIKSPNILEWLEFAAQGEDIANSLKARSDFSAWPSELRKVFKVFVASKYRSTPGDIRKELDQFRKPLTGKGFTQQYDFLGEETETVTVKAAIEKKPDNQKGTLEKTEKKKYPVGILTKEIGSSFEVRVLTEEELTGYLQKEANVLVASDSRMIKDIENIVQSLRVDPYGLGTRKLNAMFVQVGHRSLPVRSINPRKRIGLSLEHPKSQEVRVAYVIYKNGEGLGPVIGIEGIYRHEDYDRRFT